MADSMAMSDPDSLMAPSVTPRGWTAGHKLGFRFVCIYLVLYNLPFPLDVPPKMGWLDEAVTWIWRHVGVWVGDKVFGADIAMLGNGSGDSTYDYVLIFTMASLAGMGAVIWTAVDRRRIDYRRVDAWLRVMIRYVLAFTMFSYGFAKVFKTQFPFPSPDRLQSTYGESSPMGLLWTMMGYSTPYNVFTGGVEVLGGTLLLWRRTSLLGALVSAAAMTNVVMLNVCYDVPVKLYSSHLLLMSVYVMAPDLGRLAAIFIQNRPVPAAPVPTPLPRRLAWARRGVKAALIGYVLYMEITNELDRRALFGDDAPTPEIYGVYAIDTCIVNGRVQTDGARWRTIGFARAGRTMVRTMDSKSQRFGGSFDDATHLLTLEPYTDVATKPSVVLYGHRDGHLTLLGVIDHQPILVTATHRDPAPGLLVSRGFHWINEMPLNR
jgi:hypothetical protein